ncbi:hypothetical protein DV737_g440, partial [Chaetothyriales sp. CBS 132003]
MAVDSQASPPSQEAIESAEKLYNAIQMAFPEAVRDFESKWTAWDVVCHSQTAPASSLNTYVRTDEFEALKRLGPKTISFVVFKLTRDTDQNSYGVLLYNALENDPNYSVNLDQAIVSKEGLWRYSSQIVELNYQRNKIVNEHARAWKEHCQRSWLSSDSDVYTDGEAYWDLLDMGTSIIPHIMVEYHDDPGGFWFQLLHQIIHGRKMNAYMFQKRVLFELWCQFFNKGEHDQAPLYIPTQMDHRIRPSSFAEYVPR